MSSISYKKQYFKHAIAYLAWFCAVLTVSLPAPVQGDLLITNDEDKCCRTRTAYIVAGLTVVAIAGAIAWIASANGHHRHHTHSSGASSVDNYRPYSSYSSYYSYYDSYDYSERSDRHGHDHHHHHDRHSGDYSSNPYSIFSDNDVSSWSGSSESERRDNRVIRSRVCKGGHTKTMRDEEQSISGHFTTNNYDPSDQEKSMTAFVQLPDGTSQTLGTLSGHGSVSYGPFHQKGTYTFGLCMDKPNTTPSQLKMGSVQIQVNGSEVRRHEFTAPGYAPANYEPAACCFELK